MANIVRKIVATYLVRIVLRADEEDAQIELPTNNEVETAVKDGLLDADTWDDFFTVSSERVDK